MVSRSVCSSVFPRQLPWPIEKLQKASAANSKLYPMLRRQVWFTSGYLSHWTYRRIRRKLKKSEGEARRNFDIRSIRQMSWPGRPAAISQMKSILFVDDEANVLRGLKRMLYPFADVWRTEFAGNGAEALAMLEKGAFDLIVADMRMPGLDGAQLLTEVAQRYPQMMRMILSGSWEHDLRMQAALSAHQYLSKPCSPEVLKATLDLLELVFVIKRIPAWSSNLTTRAISTKTS